jgi:hypothetical protein
MTLKTIETFITTVDPDRATVVSFPEFIAIFGGAISPKKNKSKPKSKREAFYRWILEHRKELIELLLLPENYDDWSNFDTYSDLLLFEMDLGYLTSAVLVFLESPGSIAELGAFSQIPSLSERLIVVVTDNHHPQKSFISLGPIRSIKETKKHLNSVCVIPEAKPELLATHVPVIVDMLDQKRQRTKAQEGFKSDNIQHQILLILDLINLFLVIQKTELQQLVTHFGEPIKLPRLSQIIFMLEKVGLIACKHYGKNEYYLPKKFKKVYVDYTAKAGASSFKRGKTKTLIFAEIQKDQYRRNVYESAIKEGQTK